MLGDDGVEVAAADHVPVVRVDGMVGPRHLDGAAVGDRAQAPEPVERLERIRQPHLHELVDSPWGEPVTAGLVAGERLLLDDDDVQPGAGRPVGGGGTGGTATDDEEVVEVGGHGRWGERPVGTPGTAA